MFKRFEFLGRHNVGLGHSMEVELQVEASQRVQDGTRDQPVTDSHGFGYDDDDPQEEQETIVATGRQRRQIRPPRRYDRGSGIGSSVIGNVDSDYAGDLDKRRFLTGCVFTLSGFAISWKVTLQSTVTLSTMEAKYMVAVEIVKEAIWLKGLISDLDLQQDETVVFCDSQSAIHLTKNQMYHEMTKHIDVRYHFLQWL
jgi:hypothetical protein